MLESEFQKIMAENNNDVEAITYDQFLIFVRQHPLDGSPDENDTLRKKEVLLLLLTLQDSDAASISSMARLRNTTHRVQSSQLLFQMRQLLM